jgi:predicted XRE-type DNA-binding protein
MTMIRRSKIEVGSGNIFADLGLPDADDMLLKSMIVIELQRIIQRRKFTQTAAAKVAGISQADLSRILRGRFRGYSEAKLMRMLTAFGQDVQITTKPHPKAGEAGRIIFRPQSRKPRTAGRTARGAADTVTAVKTKRKSDRTRNLAEFFAPSPLRRSGMKVRRIKDRPRNFEI